MTAVGLLFGGANSEHEVSCESAAEVARALADGGFDVVPIGIDRRGRFHRVDRVSPLDSLGDGALFPDLAGVDVVFPALHGRFGEDGTVQGMLEAVGVPYVGCGVLSSALAMDKRASTRALAAVGIGGVPTHSVTARDRSLASAAAEVIGYPIFVKPNRAGSSVGATLVNRRSGLRGAIDAALAEDDRALIQPVVAGDEVDVGILELPDGRLVVGAPLRVRPSDRSAFFDYEAKYSPGGVEFEVPALLPVEVIVQLVETAERVFGTLGCSGLARIDFFVRDDGSVLVNEINTMPGLTSHSQFPLMFASIGMGFGDVVSALVATALARSSSTRARGAASPSFR